MNIVIWGPFWVMSWLWSMGAAMPAGPLSSAPVREWSCQQIVVDAETGLQNTEILPDEECGPLPEPAPKPKAKARKR